MGIRSEAAGEGAAVEARNWSNVGKGSGARNARKGPGVRNAGLI